MMIVGRFPLVGPRETMVTMAGPEGQMPGPINGHRVIDPLNPVRLQTSLANERGDRQGPEITDVLMNDALEQIMQGIPVQESVGENRAGIDLRAEDFQVLNKGGSGQFVLDIAPRLELEH